MCDESVYHNNERSYDDKTSDKGKAVPVPDLLRPLHYLSMYVRTHVVPLIDVPD
jgi:hypothetical protein